MKKKIILILALFVIIFSFAGCRNQGSASSLAGTASSSVELNSAANAVSQLESNGQLLDSQVSGVVSNVESAGNQLGSQVSGVISGAASALTSSK